MSNRLGQRGLQAVRLGTRDYLDTFKKQTKEEVAGGSSKGGPEEPPIIDELRESLVPSVAYSLHALPCTNFICF